MHVEERHAAVRKSHSHGHGAERHPERRWGMACRRGRRRASKRRGVVWCGVVWVHTAVRGDADSTSRLEARRGVRASSRALIEQGGEALASTRCAERPCDHGTTTRRRRKAAARARAGAATAARDVPGALILSTEHHSH